MIDAKDLQGVKDFFYFRDVKDDILQFLDGTKELVRAETTHWTSYDEHFKWLRTELTGFGGIPNHGKSKFVIFLSALKMFYSKWKVAIYSPETSPSLFLFANYLHTFTGKSIFGDFKPEKGQIQLYDKLLEDRLFLCEPEKMPTFKGIIERFKNAYEYHGCDMFIIDPFNCLDREWEHSQRDDRYVGDFLDHYKDFLKQTYTCGVVVMHPKASIKRAKDGVDHDCPTAYDLAGGAMWNNKLDNLIFVHRPHIVAEWKNSTVLIRHTKIKKKEIVGNGGDAVVDFNFKTNRYCYNGLEPDFSK
jgi:twinkle protein